MVQGVVRNPPANAGDPGSILELGRSPEVGNGNPLQYSCLENPMERGAWWATVHGVTKSQTQLRYCICMRESWIWGTRSLKRGVPVA